MQLALSIALSLGFLILGLAFLAVLRMRNIDPVSKIAGVFAPATTVAAPITGAQS